MNKNTSLVVGSIKQVAMQKGIAPQVAIMEALQSGNCRIIGVDTSYSMKEPDVKVEGGVITRYAKACKELAKLQADFAGTVLVVSFSDEAEFCLDGVPSNQENGTYLTSFFNLVENYDGLAEFFIICDGDLNDYDYENCVAAARKMVSKVNTVYIGNADSQAQLRLKEIAAAGKGQNASNVNTKDFAQTVTLMLGSGK